MKIGAQLFTVRDFCKDLDEMDKSLKKLADIGFKYVQVSGVCEYDPAWLRDTLKKYGLECILTHTDAQKMIKDPETVVNNHNVFDCDYIGIGAMPGLFDCNGKTVNEIVDDFFANFKKVTDTFKKNGKLLMYHNHAGEFVKLPGGKNVLDVLSEGTAPDEMGFTLDLYWIQYGGCNPVDIIEKLSGRISCVHFKDYMQVRDSENPVRMAVVGEGNLNWDKIIPACEKAGVKYAFIEQDMTYGEDPFDCLKRSFDFLVAKGLEVE